MDHLIRTFFLLVLAVGMTGLPDGTVRGAETSDLRAEWSMPPQCQPFDSVRIQNLKAELHQTGYRLAIAIHPEQRVGSDGRYAPRDLYIINADGTGLTQLTDTPEKDERVPRTSPDGTMFTYNYGDYLVDVKTLKTRDYWGGYVWTPDSKQTVYCEKNRLVYTDIATGKTTKPVRVERTVSVLDMSCDRKWLIFEIRKFRGCPYSIDFMPTSGGPIRKMPNHPAGGGECHPAFSPDGKWMCWNSGGSLSVRRFDQPMRMMAAIGFDDDLDFATEILVTLF